jgi:hypothetical protein
MFEDRAVNVVRRDGAGGRAVAAFRVPVRTLGMQRIAPRRAEVSAVRRQSFCA